MCLVSDVSDGRNALVCRAQHIPVYKELRFFAKKKKQPAQNRTSSPRQIDPYAIFGPILYIYTECKCTRIVQST